MTSRRWLSVVCAVSLAAACNSGSTDDAGTDGSSHPDSGGVDMGGSPDLGGTDLGGTDMGAVDMGSTDGGGLDLSLPDLGSDAGGCSGTLLTVKNYLAWCSVAVNGMTASPAGEQTVCIPSGGDVTLVHTALAGFELGDWHHTDGDTGSGDPGTVSGSMSTAHETVTGSGTDCVWVCCPFVGGTGCPTTDQCP